MLPVLTMIFIDGLPTLDDTFDYLLVVYFVLYFRIRIYYFVLTNIALNRKVFQWMRNRFYLQQGAGSFSIPLFKG